MKRNAEKKRLYVWLTECLVLLWGAVAEAQRPQDNWYLEKTWTKTMAATNGGLSVPYGVTVGRDQRIYVGDEGQGRVQVYLPDGTFSFAITNGFGGGLTFGQPRGMITDRNGNLYVADTGRNAVYVFTGDGAFIRRIGGVTGSGDGQLSGAIDVAVSEDACYVLESGNHRVSVFSLEGVFQTSWGGYGTLDGKLINPRSIAYSREGLLYVTQLSVDGMESFVTMKCFSKEGLYKWKKDLYETASGTYCFIEIGPASVRVDPSGLVHVISAYYYTGSGSGRENTADYSHRIRIFNSDGTLLSNWATYVANSAADSLVTWPCHSTTPDGSMILCNFRTKSLFYFRRAMREQWAPPRNALPMPAVAGIKQRANSPLVDIDYEVTDADDSTVHTALLIFTNGTPTLAGCIRPSTLAEGTATNLGPGMAANVPHRVTWDAGADWGIDLGTFRVAVLAKDSRQNLLDIHYLRLKDEQGLPKMTISRSPLLPNDFMQIYWWLLANNDSAISLASGRVYGVTGAYAGKILCSNEVSITTDGRAFAYERMNVREATASELAWARAAATTNSVEVWTPGRSVGGRPKAINEYGFDSGSWGSSAWWVVAP